MFFNFILLGIVFDFIRSHLIYAFQLTFRHNFKDIKI